MIDFERTLEKSIIKLARKEKAQNIKRLQSQLTSQSKLNFKNKFVSILGVAASILFLIYFGIFNNNSNSANNTNASISIQTSDSNISIANNIKRDKQIFQKIDTEILTNPKIVENNLIIPPVKDTLEKVNNALQIADITNLRTDQKVTPMSSSKPNTISRFYLQSNLQVLEGTRIIDSSNVLFSFQNGTSNNYISYKDSIIINMTNTEHFNKVKACYTKNNNLIVSWIDNNGSITIDTRSCIGNFLIIKKR